MTERLRDVGGRVRTHADAQRFTLRIEVATDVIRVLVAEDMHLIRGALVALIGLEEDMEVVAELDRGDLIEPTALRVEPDVAVLDIDLPGLDG